MVVYNKHRFGPSIIYNAKGVITIFFQRLEDLRIDADLTQQQVADILGCKREVYRRYEKGIHEIPVWAVIKLANYYQTSTDYILGLTDNHNFKSHSI